MCAVDADRPRDAATGNLICTYYWAFISVSETDRVKDFPTTIPTRSGEAWNPNANWYFRDGTASPRIAATSWASLLDGSVDNTAKSGGLDFNYWTGTRGTGTLAAAGNCLGWSSNAVMAGLYGHREHKDTGWIGAHGVHCLNFASVLCACM